MSKRKKNDLKRNETSEAQSRKLKTSVILNVGSTEYSIIKKVAKESLNWKLSENDSSSWDVTWTDTAVPCEKLSKMKPYQKINHFPGMHGICKKHYLAWNLNKMQKNFPSDYNFYPKTFVLPGDYSILKQYADKSRTFIVKPEASSQGQGIYLVKSIEDINLSERLVVQEYLANPYLIDGLKFDLRVYVLVKSCNPLLVYMHEDGLTRLATEKYDEPVKDNFGKSCMHLTNYAINKNNVKFVFNKDENEDSVGHKRSLASTFKLLQDKGEDVEKLKRGIEDIVCKTLCCVQPALSFYYKNCRPNDVGDSMCFELLGFDIILDCNLKPWLLEVNHSPSFTTDSPLDVKIKHRVIKETLEMMNVTSSSRLSYQNNRKMRYFDIQKVEILNVLNNDFVNCDNDESRNGFTCIFNDEKMKGFSCFLETSTKLWLEVSKHNVHKAKNKKEVSIKSMTKTRSIVPRRRPNLSNTSLIKPSQSLIINDEAKETDTLELKKIIENNKISFNFLNGKDLLYYNQLNSIFQNRRHSITYLKGTEFHSSVIKLLKPIQKPKESSIGGFLAPKSFEFIPICLSKSKVYK
jgi:tubulin polyglutamylase TTLL6/13